MRIALTTSGTTLSAPLDQRFGRAPKCLIYNTADETYVVIDNEQNLNAPQGAGVQTAETVARAGANCVVTGHCGPKAFKVLSAAGIAVHNTDLPTVFEALKAFRDGTIPAAESSDVEGHWV